MWGGSEHRSGRSLASWFVRDTKLPHPQKGCAGVEEVYIFKELHHSAGKLGDSLICKLGEAFLKTPATRSETGRSLRDLGAGTRALDQQNLVSKTAKTLQFDAVYGI